MHIDDVGMGKETLMIRQLLCKVKYLKCIEKKVDSPSKGVDVSFDCEMGMGLTSLKLVNKI